jgi:prolipoprotein diacylglyceryltransferase
VYELLLGLGLLAVLTLLDRRLKPDARKPGLFAGVFLLGFFGVRCGLELVKAGPATGLWLSVPFAGVGAWLVVLLPRRRSAGA